MATKASINKKLGRVRPPRVHITYDVHTGGAIEKKDVPFVVGVLADLSANSAKSLPKLKDRKFIEIDRDTFDQVLAKAQPTVSMKVPNKITSEGGTVGVKLDFKRLEDFEPQNVARKVEPVKQLLELRKKLSNLRSSLAGNDELEKALQDAITETESLRAKTAAQAATEQAEEAPKTEEGER